LKNNFGELNDTKLNFDAAEISSISKN